MTAILAHVTLCDWQVPNQHGAAVLNDWLQHAAEAAMRPSQPADDGTVMLSLNYPADYSSVSVLPALTTCTLSCSTHTAITLITTSHCSEVDCCHCGGGQIGGIDGVVIGCCSHDDDKVDCCHSDGDSDGGIICRCSQGDIVK